MSDEVRKESEIKRSQSEEQGVESERPNDEPISKNFSRVSRRERRKADKGDYESLFICRNTLKNRKTIYIAIELQDTLAEIVMSMRNRYMTIGIYVENIILHHLETYKDEINRLAEIKFRSYCEAFSNGFLLLLSRINSLSKVTNCFSLGGLCPPEA